MFESRMQAGRMLGRKLAAYKGKQNVIVLAIPRGGVETGYAIAGELGCPLGIVVSKKIPYPDQPELAIGAVCNGVIVLDKAFIAARGIGNEYVKREASRLESAVKARYRELAGNVPFPELDGKTVILTDDGIATGHTFLAALDFVGSRKPARIVAAVPVCPLESSARLLEKADEVVVLESPADFGAVGEWYHDFAQVSDDEVRKLLESPRL